MYNEIVRRAISANKNDALEAFRHLLDSCQMNAEIAEYIRENAELRVISNRAAKFNRCPTRIVEKTIYGTVCVLLLIGILVFARHVYNDVRGRNASQYAIERP
jgi:hypothetical protein